MGKARLDPKQMGLILSSRECIKKAECALEEMKDKLKRARSMATKRSIKNAIEFWEAIIYHLNSLSENQRTEN